MNMRVLIACEYSGRVRDAFCRHGHDAMSCDLLQTEVDGPHYQGPVEDVLNDGWDLMIAHHNKKPDQIIQPWQFGHGEVKATCLWLHNLPKLMPTDCVNGREPRVHRMPPGPDRWKERSRTFEGVAKAMGEQWGN